MTQARQGDVLIERATKIPTNAKRITTIDGRPANILALGETSGHGHVLDGECDVYEVEDGFYLDVKEEAALRHLLVASGVWTEEHYEIPEEPGIYKISLQYQHDPYANAIRRVED